MFRKVKRPLIKAGFLSAVLLIAFLASGVVLAQSSQDYDLGCRAVLTAGGESADYPAVGVRLQSSAGQWNAGRSQIQGSGIILESGYILAVGQGLGAATTAAIGSESVTPTAIQSDADVFLPAVYAFKVIRFVRPCNWPAAATSAAAVTK